MLVVDYDIKIYEEITTSCMDFERICSSFKGVADTDASINALINLLTPYAYSSCQSNNTSFYDSYKFDKIINGIKGVINIKSHEKNLNFEFFQEDIDKDRGRSKLQIIIGFIEAAKLYKSEDINNHQPEVTAQMRKLSPR